MARPSGMLWTAMARVMKRPRSCPPPNDTPTPTPSVNEWSVMTPTIRSALRASKLCIWAKDTGLSRCWIWARVKTTKPSPRSTPKTVRHNPNSAPSYASPKLAASISPLASAFEIPSHVRDMSLTNRKGNAPAPVATAVSMASLNTSIGAGACM